MQKAILKGMAWLQARQSHEEGQTAIEYAVVVALVSLALALALQGFGENAIESAFDYITGQLPFGGGS